MISFHGCEIPYNLITNGHVRGTFEQLEMDAARELFTHGDRVVVAGAGTGWLLACIAEQVGAENVLGVEPIRALARLVEQDVAVNGTPLRCRWAAITPGGKSSCAHVDPRNWAKTTVGGGLGAHVPGVALTALQNLEYDCLALDIEGGEAEVLTGPALAGIRKLLLELHVHVLGVSRSGALDDSLRESGLQNDSSIIRDSDGAVIQTWTRPARRRRPR
jgi:Protein-L-isoaspartate(D-aspartate) O-methyltransferase (PCMT)